MKGSVCPTCSHSIIPGSAYCDNCGRRLINLPAAQPEAAAGGEVETPLQPPTGRICPQCYFNNIPGAFFCIDCGAALGSLPAPDDSPAAVLAPSPDSVAPPPPYTAFITGSLVLEASSVLLPLPKERIEITIGREDPVSSIFPDVNLEPHGGHEAGVGRKHARLVIIEGRLFLVDLNSTNGTFVNRRKIPAGTPQPVNDGDEIRLGRFVLRYQAS
jgi:hypothetical protein